MLNITTNQHNFLLSLHKKAETNDATAKFKDKFLAVSPEQGEFLFSLLVENNCKHCIEFGSSLGISTMYLAAAMHITGGRVIATERMPEKAATLKQHLEQAELITYVEIRVGDALHTLADSSAPIDFVFLDGQKNMYWQIYRLLQPYFRPGTIIVADNTETHFAREYKENILKDSTVQNKIYSWERSEMIVSVVQ